jgi:RNA-binding protein
MEELKGKQRRYLKGLANQLKPTVYLGKEGISPALLRSIEDAYNTSELIKVKLEQNCPLDRKELGPRLAEETSSYLIQILGRTLLLYRPDAEEPKLQLP